MAAAKKKTARERKQDRARVAGGQDYEVRYESRKTRRSAPAVKKAVKKVGNSRERVENGSAAGLPAFRSNRSPGFLRLRSKGRVLIGLAPLESKRVQRVNGPRANYQWAGI